MPRQPALFGVHFARQLWRLTRVYWRSRDAGWGGLLLALAIALELGTVYANILIANGQRAIFDALELKAGGRLVAAIGIFLTAAAALVTATTLRIYVRQALEIRWREQLTSFFLDRWIAPAAYAQMQRNRDAIDNPDQRVAEDVRDFVASSLGLSLSLLSAVVTLFTFGGLLWRLSRDWPLQAFGIAFEIPGFMMWVAVAFSLLSIAAAHFVGRRLVPINYAKLRVEADFRYGLVQFRDNVERVVLSRGQAVERLAARSRFQQIVENWWQLIRAQRNLSFLTSGVGQLNELVPILVAAPAYFAGSITLGHVAQVRFAYGQVAGGLGWFVNAYQEIARWRANVERLCSFLHAMERAERDLDASNVVVAASPRHVLRLADLRLESPGGRVVLDRVNATVAPGDRVAIVGPSGTGKTMLMRAIVGMWPFGAGRIEVPAGAHAMFLPQRPYIPAGTLRAALSFPAPEGTFPDERIREMLRLVGLERFEGRLADDEQWEQQLSPHEQQQVGFVRLLLHEPEWVFIDKATSDLEEDVARRLYGLLAERLPKATVVSVAQRPEIADYHTRRWTLVPGAAGVSLRAA